MRCLFVWEIFADTSQELEVKFSVSDTLHCKAEIQDFTVKGVPSLFGRGSLPNGSLATV